MSEIITPPKKRSREEIIEALERLTQEPGFFHSLTFILMRDFFYSAAEAADINWRDHISFQEAAFLVGLMVKHTVDFDTPPSTTDSERQIKETYALFKELQHNHIGSFFEGLSPDSMEGKSTEEKERAIQEHFGQGDLMTEPIFYGGSGAYDFQYWELAPKKYAGDLEWLVKNRGFSMETAVKIARAIQDNQVKKFQDSVRKSRLLFKRRGSFEELCRNNIDIFTFSPSEIVGFSESELNSFFESFALIPGTVNHNLSSTGDYNALSSHPIVKIREDTYFIPINFLLAESLYESPFYWMNADTEYRATAAKNRGETTEQFAYEMLQKVFGKENVLKNVQVTRKKGERVTDIDVLAFYGNKAVIFQAKSKKLTELSKQGNTESLKKDFSEAVQSAYEQGLRSRKAIIDKTNQLVDSTGNVLQLDESIDDAYILCLSTEYYPAVTSQLEAYLQKEASDPYPIALSIFDLELLVFYLDNPFDFLYYLRQRAALTESIRAASEIALLAYHIRVGIKPIDDVQFIAVDEQFAQLIDANFPQMTGRHPKTGAAARLYKDWGNKKFQELIEDIKKARRPQFMDAIFFLYDLSNDTADNLIRMIESIKQKTIANKKGGAFTIEPSLPGKKKGLTFLTMYSPTADVSRALVEHAELRKYKGKGDEWLAFGWRAGSEYLFDAMAFTKEPWQEDPLLEQAADKLLVGGKMVKMDGTKMGRNEKCLCGSGVKYKRCHGK